MARFSNRQLFLAAVLIWGTTWHAIVYQVAASTPELGVTLRFAIAGALVLVFARWRGDALPHGAATHARLLVQGAFMYSWSYLCVYYAEQRVPSGLVAVGYSASPLLAGVGATLLWRAPLTRRFVIGGCFGIAGVGLIFWPEIAATRERPAALAGLGFTLAAVALSACGSLATSRNAHHGVPFWPGLGWSMLYGALLSSLTLWQQPQVLPTTVSWWLSLAYLALAGSVLAFAAYLTLQDRLGPGKASTVGVMTPVFALVVSTAFEGFRPDAFTLAGAALAIGGNVLMLRGGIKGGARAAE
jgi:drug/metabolite transporter (DMT)-like permease